MGNSSCLTAREKSTTFKEKSQLYLRSMTEKAALARSHTLESFANARLRAKGYSLNYFNDNGLTKPITDFESTLHLCKVPLDTFE